MNTSAKGVVCLYNGRVMNNENKGQIVTGMSLLWLFGGVFDVDILHLSSVVVPIVHAVEIIVTGAMIICLRTIINTFSSMAACRVH